MMGRVFFSGGNPKTKASSTGILARDLAVGSSVYLNVAGVKTEFLVVNQGIPSNSSLYDSSCDGVWLLMKDVYENRAWHSSASNSYKDSTLHAYLNGDFLNLFDSGVRAKIKTVKIPFVNGTGKNSVASGSNGLSAQVFLLGSYEIGWTKSINSMHPEDGACLSYFSGTAATDSKRIALLKGVANAWYLRSPSTINTSYAIYVTASGGSSTRSVTNTTTGARPAFVLQSDALFDEETMIMKESA